MDITGPFLDRKKQRGGQPRCWFLRYSTPKKNADGTTQLSSNGRPVLQRHRPYYQTKRNAEADKSRIAQQATEAGAGDFLFDRGAAADYEAAKRIIGGVALVDVAKFWRKHHPDKPKPKLEELFPLFLTDVEERLGKERHWSDLKSRGGIFLKTYGSRYPDTVTREDVLSYVKGLDAAPRTKRNHKTTICEFFNWLLDQKYVAANPAAGIKRRMLPREPKNEIRFLKLEDVQRYLRTLERYDPQLIPHEIVQLLAGVRADDEMSDFRAEFVLTETKEILIPASVAKTETREVIQNLEPCFWTWWSTYGVQEGLLRPANYEPRWFRIRVLATIHDAARADEAARLPIKNLLRQPSSKAALADWPWNARRRTFCTYHVAKHQSADKTALIMRHRGSPYTLHNSYRGLGVTQADGNRFFQIQPAPVLHPVRPDRPLRGIVLRQCAAMH